MGLRFFKLPQDVPTLLDVIPKAFQYPEHPGWGVQPDEITSFADGFKMAGRLWPIISALSRISPSIGDVLLGLVWEEDGQAVGLVNVGRQGTSARWYIGNVAVLPEYRRRGIARALVEGAVQLARERKGEAVILDVIADNLPARQLYEQMGFQHFADSTELEYTKDAPPPDVALPDGYQVVLLSTMDWRTRYELDLRLKPANVQQYQPVEVSYYRQPLLLRPLIPIVSRAGGKTVAYAIYHTASQHKVARVRYSARTKPGGVNDMAVTFDPAHEALTSYLIAHTVYSIWQSSPGRRIEYNVPSWQNRLCEEAMSIGLTVRHTSQSMGMLLH